MVSIRYLLHYPSVNFTFWLIRMPEFFRPFSSRLLHKYVLKHLKYTSNQIWWSFPMELMSAPPRVRSIDWEKFDACIMADVHSRLLSKMHLIHDIILGIHQLVRKKWKKKPKFGSPRRLTQLALCRQRMSRRWSAMRLEMPILALPKLTTWPGEYFFFPHVPPEALLLTSSPWLVPSEDRKFQMKDYAPLVFGKIRHMFGVKTKEYLVCFKEQNFHRLVSPLRFVLFLSLDFPSHF